MRRDRRCAHGSALCAGIDGDGDLGSPLSAGWRLSGVSTVLAHSLDVRVHTVPERALPGEQVHTEAPKLLEVPAGHAVHDVSPALL